MNKLMMGLALVSLTCQCLAEEKVDKTVEAKANGYVRIEHVNGQAKVSVWDKNEVKVSGTLGDRTDKFIFERDGDEVIIKVKVKKNNNWNNWSSEQGDDLEIMLPANSKVSYSAVNADVELSDILGGTDVETVNGSIEVDKLNGRIRLSSVNGNISARNLTGDLRVETVNGNINSRSSSGKEDSYESVNGNITVSTESQELRAETVNGNMDLNLNAIHQLNVESVNGTIEAKMVLQKNGEVNASTVGGTVELYFQPDLSARFDIQAHAGGSIVNKLSEHKMQRDKYGPSRWLEFSLNGGSAKVNVSTVSGTVRLNAK
jgi:DUF4097 and DUF4098 domain-containing protein YvlB